MPTHPLEAQHQDHCRTIRHLHKLLPASGSILLSREVIALSVDSWTAFSLLQASLPQTVAGALPTAVSRSTDWVFTAYHGVCIQPSCIHTVCKAFVHFSGRSNTPASLHGTFKPPLASCSLYKASIMCMLLSSFQLKQVSIRVTCCSLALSNPRA